jgi:hypothetical protein
MADCLEQWLQEQGETLKEVRKLVLDLDNGPENSGQRSQWLFRLVLLAQKFQWTIVRVFYPPSHSEYNPIERLWGLLENYWRGELLDREAAVLGYDTNRTYDGIHPQVHRVTKQYAKGVKRNKAEKKRLEQWLKRNPGLEKWVIEIAPPPSAFSIRHRDSPAAVSPSGWLFPRRLTYSSRCILAALMAWRHSSQSSPRGDVSRSTFQPSARS